MSTPPELLPCPFCGKAPKVERIVGLSSEPIFLKIVCRSCPFDFDGYPENKRKSMVNAWNKRADYADAESHRALMRGLAASHKESLGKDCGVWDSRNISQ